MKNALYITLIALALAAPIAYTLRDRIRYCLVRVRNYIVQKLMELQARLKIHGLRTAIVDADKDKEATGRKNMVVFNSATGQFEPVQKRLLKAAARATRNRSNKAHTPGRKRNQKPGKTRYFTTDRVRTIENKSLYVTR